MQSSKQTNRRLKRKSCSTQETAHPDSVQVQLLKLSGEAAAAWELPGATPLCELQAMAEAKLEMSCRVKVLLQDGRLVRDLGGLSLESLL